MLFFRPKQKASEILPPPPMSDEELEESVKEKPRFFDEITKPKAPETFPEEEEFSSLVKELKAPKQKKATQKKKKGFATKRQTAKTKPKKIKLIKAKILPTQKKVKIIKKESKKPKIKSQKEHDFGLFNFELPKGIEAKGIRLPGALEGFDFDSIGEFGQEKAKPKEILEAEDEIKNAIKSIKEQERPSLFNWRFSKGEEVIAPEAEMDNISVIQNNIRNARLALTRFDLEGAKKNYLEIMKLYNKISPKEQAKVYNAVKDLYFERKNAEELRV